MCFDFETSKTISTFYNFLQYDWGRRTTLEILMGIYIFFGKRNVNKFLFFIHFSDSPTLINAKLCLRAILRFRNCIFSPHAM